MKKVMLAVLFLSAVSVYAQVAADIHDFFYADLERWETLGLVKKLPHARPYPLQVIKPALESVMEKGDPVQRAIADAHYRRFFSRTATFGGKSEAALDVNSGNKQIGAALSYDLNYLASPLLSASASVDVWAINKLPDDEILTAGDASAKDVLEDNAKIGPLWMLPSINTAMAVGTPDTYLSTGLMRASWGPFYRNGVIAGPQALHTGQANFLVDRDLWAFNFSLYSLSATSVANVISDNTTTTLYPEKYLVVHSLEFRPFERFSASLLESVVYGNRFDPAYLFPFTPFMITQGLYGFGDSSWLGLMFSGRPVDGLKLDAVFYADDLSFNDLVKLDFDTKLRFSAQAGASWAPVRSGIVSHVSLDYTAVMPYTYTHRIGSDNETLAQINYQNYTHAGASFGASLEPNSDRLNLKITLRPLEDFDIDLVGMYIRHGNVNEGLAQKWVREYLIKKDVYLSDGSINNNSASDVGHAFFYSNPFMKQNTIRHRVQTGFNALCRLPVLKTGGYMVFKLGYRFEIDINPGVSKSIYTYAGNDYGVEDANKLNDADKAAVDAEAALQYETWLKNAKGTEIRNCITAGFEYYF